MKFLIFFLFLISATGIYAAEAPDLSSLMTADDYAASGLDKLTDAERANLSTWIQHYRDGAIKGPPAPRSTEERVAQEAEEERKQDEEVLGIVANVIPKFTGWTGQTYFQLDNGQIWQQRISGTSMRYSGDDYRVTITKNWIGKYSMKHLETGRSVPVQRVQ